MFTLQSSPTPRSPGSALLHHQYHLWRGSSSAGWEYNLRQLPCQQGRPRWQLLPDWLGDSSVSGDCVYCVEMSADDLDVDPSTGRYGLPALLSLRPSKNKKGPRTHPITPLPAWKRLGSRSSGRFRLGNATPAGDARVPRRPSNLLLAGAKLDLMITPQAYLLTRFCSRPFSASQMMGTVSLFTSLSVPSSEIHGKAATTHACSTSGDGDGSWPDEMVARPGPRSRTGDARQRLR